MTKITDKELNELVNRLLRKEVEGFGAGQLGASPNLPPTPQEMGAAPAQTPPPTQLAPTPVSAIGNAATGAAPLHEEGYPSTPPPYEHSSAVRPGGQGKPRVDPEHYKTEEDEAQEAFKALSG